LSKGTFGLSQVKREEKMSSNKQNSFLRSSFFWGSLALTTVSVLASIYVVQNQKKLLANGSNNNSNSNGNSKRKPTDVWKFYLDYKTSKEKTRLEICQVARMLCPEYFADKIDEQMQIEQIQGGITNMLWKVTNDQGQSCLVRVYGENTEVMIDREMECRVFAELSNRKFGPKLWGRFVNGRVEGYFDAKPFDPPQKMGERSPVDFPVLIAQQLARMHDISDMPVSHDPQLWNMLEKFYKLAKGVSFPRSESKSRALGNIDLDRFTQELQWLKTVLPSPENGHGKSLKGISEQAKAIAFKQVFAHNDLLSGNILYVPSERRAQFIDFEYGAYNYVAFDIADHFCEYAGFDFDLDRWYPEEELEKHFWKAYINAVGFKVSPAELEPLLTELVLWTNRFALTAHLLWFFWAIIQAKYSVIDVDFLAYAGRRRDGYLLHKKQFFSL
jgi:ethanolamine kinase